MEEKKKTFYKKWLFWLGIIVVIIIVVVIIKYIDDTQKTKETLRNIGEGATDYIQGTKNTTSHIDEFTYNYTTGEVEYKPQITIEKYNSIKEGMTEKEVINILGDGEKLQPEPNSGFLITWGDLNLNNPPYYRIQITFNSSGCVTTKSQMGLD